LERPRLRQRGRRRGIKNAAQVKRDVEVESSTWISFPFDSFSVQLDLIKVSTVNHP
jgi:hypothetical protein